MQVLHGWCFFYKTMIGHDGNTYLHIHRGAVFSVLYIYIISIAYKWQGNQEPHFRSRLWQVNTCSLLMCPLIVVLAFKSFVKWSYMVQERVLPAGPHQSTLLLNYIFKEK